MSKVRHDEEGGGGAGGGASSRWDVHREPLAPVRLVATAVGDDGPVIVFGVVVEREYNLVEPGAGVRVVLVLVLSLLRGRCGGGGGGVGG